MQRSIGMLTAIDIDSLAERAASLAAPTLSLFATVPPGTGDAWLTARTRIASSIDELEVSPSVRERVDGFLTQPTLGGRCLVLFANEREFIARWLPTQLPIINSQTGRVRASWGKPDVLPLRYLESNRLPLLALRGDRDHWSLYRVYLGAAEEIAHARRSDSDAEHDDLQQSKQQRPAYTPSRGGGAYDQAQDHLDELARRFLREAAQAACEAARDHGCGLVLLGTTEWTAALAEQMPANILIDRLPHVAEKHLAERVSEVAARVQRDAQERTVTAARARGTGGVGPTLEALQEGRLRAVVSVWPLPDATVFEDPATGYVAGRMERARLADAAPKKRPLAKVLPDLALRHGTRLTFVSGAPATALRQDLGGLAGVPRHN